MKEAPTAYSLLIMHRDVIYAVRDPYGNRPLCIGRLIPVSDINDKGKELQKASLLCPQVCGYRKLIFTPIYVRVHTVCTCRVLLSWLWRSEEGGWCCPLSHSTYSRETGFFQNLKTVGSLASAGVAGTCRMPGLLLWVPGSELWSLCSKHLSPGCWCSELCVRGGDVPTDVCTQVCLHIHVLSRGQRTTSVTIFRCFLLFFLRQGLTETEAHRF